MTKLTPKKRLAAPPHQMPKDNEPEGTRDLEAAPIGG